MNRFVFLCESFRESMDTTITRIESLASSLLVSLLSQEDGSLVIPGGRGICSVDNLGSFIGARDLASFLRVLSSSHELLKKKRVVTQRELYYSHADFFVSQDQLMTALQKVQSALGVPRHSLGVYAAGKGWFAGNISTLEEQEGSVSGGEVWVATKKPRAIPSSSVCEEQFTRTTSRFLLVVEKECIFRRLCDEKIWEREGMSCVLISGCGFPDFATRAFLKQLVHKNKTLPVLILTDYNPFGLAIYLNFAFGSKASPDGDVFNVPEAIWLGLHFEDMEEFNIKSSSMQFCTHVDLKKAKSLLTNKNVIDNDFLTSECETWISTRRKCEIEALGSGTTGLNVFMEYLETKCLRELVDVDDESNTDESELILEPTSFVQSQSTTTEGKGSNLDDDNDDEDDVDDDDDDLW